jgi:hypothetical protein
MWWVSGGGVDGGRRSRALVPEVGDNRWTNLQLLNALPPRLSTDASAQAVNALVAKRRERAAGVP